MSLGAAWLARSPALLGFGGDSSVELLSAAVVLWRFYSPSRGDHAELKAARIAGSLLFVLAAFVSLASVLTLLRHVQARPSPIGIALLILAVEVTSPGVGQAKRKGFVTGIDIERLIAVRAILRSEMPDETLYGGLARAGLPSGRTGVAA